MQIEIKDLERISICPILYKNKWDYSETKVNPLFSYTITEMMRWYWKRGGLINPEALIRSISQYSYTHNIDEETKITIEKAAINYLSGTTYKSMSQPIYKKELIFNINPNIVIKVTPPVIFKKEKHVYFLYWNKGKVSDEEFLTSYEIMALSLWGMMSLDKNPCFINLYLDEETKEIKEQVFRIKNNYLNYIGKRLNRLKIPPIQLIPDSIICNSCIRRTECPIQKTENWHWK